MTGVEKEMSSVKMNHLGNVNKYFFFFFSLFFLFHRKAQEASMLKAAISDLIHEGEKTATGT